ncbi:MAG: 1-deoxy-D-xylulose-5-phosphate synthase [Spirochaetales bacterium]|nr:1-deoxy-D-xylulose-5-phosphate synthase [Candidatus Physcosoma equi]
MKRDAHDFSHYRDTVVGAVVDIAKEDKNVVFVDSDLSSCIGSTAFQKAYPDRFFNVGIAEANMVGVAAGMASVGLVPVVHSFGCFMSRRDYDQLFISVGYTHQRVIAIGSDPGITAQYNGGTHMPFEDIALMRQIPDMVIIEPSDGQSLYDLTWQVYKSGKAAYIRTPRKGINFRYGMDQKIELGKGIELADGKDVAIIATGALMVDCAMEAKELLAQKGIQATVVDLHTIRPLDTELVEKVAERCGKVLVCENGRYAGGVGEMIASHLATTKPVRMAFLNVGERYGEVGNLKYLKEAFGFTGANVALKAEELCK